MDSIEKFKNLHEGKNVFILASGPSLAELDLSPLDRRIVIGLNRSPLIYPNNRYNCTMDHRLFEEYRDILQKTPYLFTFEDRPFGIPLKLLGSQGFSWDLTEGIYSGYTVSYFALQIAVYMGFQKIFYLGLDLKHQGKSTHFFGHDYRSKRHETTEFPKMLMMMEYGARAIAKSNKKIEVYNCSPRSNIFGFKSASYEWAIQQ